MQVSATLRHARISPQKCRLVADAVRGAPVGKALQTLAFMPKKGARIVKKVLEAAVANAEHNHSAAQVAPPTPRRIVISRNSIDELKVAKIFVNEAPTLKRYAARAKGRGTRITKRNSHITVQVADE